MIDTHSVISRATLPFVKWYPWIPQRQTFVISFYSYYECNVKKKLSHVFIQLLVSVLAPPVQH